MPGMPDLSTCRPEVATPKPNHRHFAESGASVVREIKIHALGLSPFAIRQPRQAPPLPSSSFQGVRHGSPGEKQRCLGQSE